MSRTLALTERCRTMDGETRDTRESISNSRELSFRSNSNRDRPDSSTANTVPDPVPDPFHLRGRSLTSPSPSFAEAETGAPPPAAALRPPARLPPPRRRAVKRLGLVGVPQQDQQVRHQPAGAAGDLPVPPDGARGPPRVRPQEVVRHHGGEVARQGAQVAQRAAGRAGGGEGGRVPFLQRAGARLLVVVDEVGPSLLDRARAVPNAFQQGLDAPAFLEELFPLPWLVDLETDEAIERNEMRMPQLWGICTTRWNAWSSVRPAVNKMDDWYEYAPDSTQRPVKCDRGTMTIQAHSLLAAMETDRCRMSLPILSL